MNILRPNLTTIIIYAIGQMGWSLSSFAVSNQLSYFYMPPEMEKSASIPTFIFQGAVLGLFTIVGIVGFIGRVFDAITDPLVANYSDRISTRFGKRRTLMAVAALPFALFSFLVFFPLSHQVGTLNVVWLFATNLLFFFFMTLYVIPYNALIGELGHHEADRLKISTIISVTWALGFLIGSQIFSLQSYFEKWFAPAVAFQYAVGGFALLGFLCMMLPVLFLDEKKYCKQKDVQLEKFSDSVRSVASNKDFKLFALSDLMYWLSLTFIQLGVGYYVTTLFGFQKEDASLFLTLSLGISFLLYAPINFLANRFGKKKIILTAFLTFGLVFALVSWLDFLPLSKRFMFYFLAIAAAYPLACFGILPNAIVADLLYRHEQQTGEQQSAMFFAARNFMMKLGISLANLIFPSMLLLGKSSESPLGLRLTAISAFVFCVIGYLIFTKFKENVTER